MAFSEGQKQGIAVLNQLAHVIFAGMRAEAITIYGTAEDNGRGEPCAIVVVQGKELVDKLADFTKTLSHPDAVARLEIDKRKENGQ